MAKTGSQPNFVCDKFFFEKSVKVSSFALKSIVIG